MQNNLDNFTNTLAKTIVQKIMKSILMQMIVKTKLIKKKWYVKLTLTLRAIFPK
jgi:hypothetical protein